MKKLLLIVFVLVILLLAFPQGVLAVGTQSVPVNAAYSKTDVIFTAGKATDFGTWTLSADSGSDNLKTGALVFGVTSNADWTVTAQDLKSTDTGLMTEAVTSGAHHLTHPFQIRDPSPGSGVYSLENGATHQIQSSLATVTAFTKDIAQPLHVADRDYASTAGYTITVQFVCSNGFV
jgi:hypothetical protein